MWVITLKQTKKRGYILDSVQLKFALTYIVLIVGLLLFLNTYPLRVSRDLVFAAKESSLVTQVGTIANTLGGGNLDYARVAHTLAHADIGNAERIIVRNAFGTVVYDMREEATSFSDLAIYPEFQRVQDGFEVFHSAYAGGHFYSWAAVPILRDGEIIGSVYLQETDFTQGALIVGIGRNLFNISIFVFFIALAVAIFFSRTLTVRIKEMLAAVRMVSQGDYSYKVTLRGEDELSQLGGAFNSLTERLEETEEMRRRFVSDASHELKTPLASIQLLSDSIVQSADMQVGTIYEFVADIGQEAERLSRTTEKLLRLTRLDAELDVPVYPVDISAVARRVGQMLGPLAVARGVTITYALEEGAQVLSTEDDIHQVIFNLAENGIKYNRTGGVLAIATSLTEDAVILTLEDDGIGIPPEDMPYIFDRFYRVDKARSRDKGGSGLGLSIVRDTARQHGGFVEVIAKKQGTLVQVSFPKIKNNTL